MQNCISIYLHDSKVSISNGMRNPFIPPFTRLTQHPFHDRITPPYFYVKCFTFFTPPSPFEVLPKY